MTCQKCEIPADSYAMMPGNSICELCRFEEADCSANITPRTCQVCSGENGVQSIAIREDELLICRSCKQNYFAASDALAAC